MNDLVPSARPSREPDLKDYLRHGPTTDDFEISRDTTPAREMAADHGPTDSVTDGQLARRRRPRR